MLPSRRRFRSRRALASKSLGFLSLRIDCICVRPHLNTSAIFREPVSGFLWAYSMTSTRCLRVSSCRFPFDISDRALARLPVMKEQPRVFQLRSFVRGHHAYLAEWTPDLGEILQVHIEPGNVYD